MPAASSADRQQHGQRTRHDHGSEHATESRRRAPETAAHSRQNGSDQEEREPGDSQLRHRLRRGVVRDGQGADAGGAVRIRPFLDHQERDAAEQRQRVGRHDEIGVAPPAELPPRKREQQMDERAEDHGAQRDPDREDPVVVRLGEGAEEPEIADGEQQDAGAVFGTPPQRDEPAGDEAETRGERKRERRSRDCPRARSRARATSRRLRAGLRPQPPPQGRERSSEQLAQRRSGELVLRDEAACAALRHERPIVARLAARDEHDERPGAVSIATSS